LWLCAVRLKTFSTYFFDRENGPFFPFFLRRKPARILRFFSATADSKRRTAGRVVLASFPYKMIVLNRTVTSSYSFRNLSVPAPRIMVPSLERWLRWRFLGLHAFILATHCVHLALLKSCTQNRALRRHIGDRAIGVCGLIRCLRGRIEPGRGGELQTNGVVAHARTGVFFVVNARNSDRNLCCQ
jgi:hypothetical protein